MPPRPKVERVLEAHDLEEWGDRLEAAWVEGEASLRELADRLNRRILRSVMTGAGISPSPGEVEANYRALTGEEATAGERASAAASLQEMGIDVDGLRDDFVTHQAVHTYLTKHREASAPTADRDPVEATRERLNRLESRHRAVVADAVERLDDTDALEVGDVRAIVSASVVCDDCGAQYDVSTLVDRGGCDCA